MQHVDPYLTFDGNCAEAMRFYAATLGGKLDMMTFKDSPMAAQAPPGAGDRILHARLDLGQRVLMASDTMAGQPYDGIKGISLSVSAATAAEGKTLFDALSAGGQVTMPFQKTFWAEGFGMLVDRFGAPWMVNCEMTPQK